MAQNNWLGTAQAVKDIWLLTVTGSWSAGDTFTVTLNGKSLVGTLQATSVVSVTTVATTIKEMIMAAYGTVLTDTAATFTPNVGGRGIPEFAEYTATSSAGVVTVYATISGVPGGTFTVSDTSAGTLAVSHLATGTGPNDWNNAANWSLAAVPVSTNDVIIDVPVSILYGFAQSAVTLASLTITPRFTSSCYLGLPIWNANGYSEFRATELAIGATVCTINSGSGRIKINFGTVLATTTVYMTGATVETGRPAVQLRGTNASNVLNVIGTSTSTTQADCGWATNGETATLLTLSQDTGTVQVGTAGTGTVTLTTVNSNGGTTILYCAATTVTNGAGDMYHYTGAITTCTSSGGTWYDVSSSTYTTLTLNNGAVYNADGNVAAKTITTFNWNDSCDIIDTADRLVMTNTPSWKGRISLSPT